MIHFCFSRVAETDPVRMSVLTANDPVHARQEAASILAPGETGYVFDGDAFIGEVRSATVRTAAPAYDGAIRETYEMAGIYVPDPRSATPSERASYPEASSREASL